jgi:L-rhamnose isomerase
MPTTESQIQTAYALAKERYAALGVDTKAAMQQLAKEPISLQSWQGDEVAGFKDLSAKLTGKIILHGYHQNL